MSDAVQLHIAQLGGVASRRDLAALVGRSNIERALREGAVVRVARGRYALPGLDEARHAAVALAGIVSGRSAAMQHGWAVRSSIGPPTITVPPNRHLSAGRLRGVSVCWRPLGRSDIDGLVTTPLRTVIDCALTLPLTESLAIADSALRGGALTQQELHDAVGSLPRTGRARARLVLTQASPLAANPFESVLRALSLESVGPVLTPQLPIRLGDQLVRVDLGSRALRLAVEADSHEFHTDRRQIVRDCWRYTELVLDGWTTLRFAWWHAMFAEDWVRSAFAATMARLERGAA